MKNVLDRNQNMADMVRKICNEKNILMINMISSPGAGKTSVLECTLEEFRGQYRMAVIEGDVTTDRDARRLEKYEIPIVLINTEGGCHLDSHSIYKAMENLELDQLDVIFVENVGNLVCPSHFDLGETYKMAVVSTTEGDDKPIKYPMLFNEARVVLLNKSDLIPHTNFNYSSFEKDLRNINPKVPLYEISCFKKSGLENWYQWIEDEIKKR